MYARHHAFSSLAPYRGHSANLSDSFAKLFRSLCLAFKQGAPVCAYLVWNRLKATSGTRFKMTHVRFYIADIIA